MIENEDKDFDVDDESSDDHQEPELSLGEDGDPPEPFEAEAQVKVEHEIPLEKIDLNALWVVRRLRAKGHEAYLTGGCVRDLLLNRAPKDFDVATSARPEEVKGIFRNCRLIGRRFLLAHVVFPGGKIIETATFRAKPSDEPGEEESEDLLMMDDNVYGTIKEDAFRRDLTVNGLFYDPVAGKVIDYVGGKEDLQARLIRTIGDPEIRLQEDPVRILRSIRFANRLGFDIEPQTLVAIKNHAQELLRCAPARLQEELVRLLNSGQAKESCRLALECGVLDVLMPELLEGMGISPRVEGSAHEAEILAINDSERDGLMEYWFSMLGALDQVSSRECNISSAVAFSALLLPAYARLEKSTFNERNWIDKLCVNWSSRIRVTRRDQDIIRLLLSAIPLFALDKIHQKSAQYLVRKPWFKEALLTYILHLVATDESLEKVKIWKILAQEADKPYRQDKPGTVLSVNRFRKRRPYGRDFRRHPNKGMQNR